MGTVRAAFSPPPKASSGKLLFVWRLASLRWGLNQRLSIPGPSVEKKAHTWKPCQTSAQDPCDEQNGPLVLQKCMAPWHSRSFQTVLSASITKSSPGALLGLPASCICNMLALIRLCNIVSPFKAMLSSLQLFLSSLGLSNFTDLGSQSGS